MSSFNPKLVPTKVMYFLYYGGLSSFIPFKSIYQRQLGMSAAQNGLIQATMQLASLVSPPITGIITDKTKAYRIMIGTLLCFTIAFTIPFYFVPPTESSSVDEVISCCMIKGDDELIACPENITMLNTSTCSSMPNVTVAFDTVLYQQCFNSSFNCTLPGKVEDVYGTTFAFLVVLTAFMSFFVSPVTPLLDSSTMDTLGRDNVANFGIQRLWGAVGFGVVGLGVGYLTDVISPAEVYGPYAKNYILAFGSVALFWGVAVIVIITSIEISAPKAKGLFKGLKKLLVEPEIISFLFIVLVSGYSTGVQYSYLFWYLVDFQDFEQLILGLSLLVTCLSEIPMFWISGWICETFGYVSVLSIGLCAVSIRFFVYTVITDAWQILAIEWLHGISFALPTAAMCSYATVVAPKDAVATLISFSQTVYWGIGNMLGALLGGLLYHTYGAKTLFRVSSIICFSCGLLYWIYLGPFGVVELWKSRKREGDRRDAAAEENNKTSPAYEEKLLQGSPVEI